MSRVDENGTVHPTEDDPWNARTEAHLAFCKDCNPYALMRQRPDFLCSQSEYDALPPRLKPYFQPYQHMQGPE